MNFWQSSNDFPVLFLVTVAAVWSSFQPFCNPIWNKKSRNRFARYKTSLSWKKLRRSLPHAPPPLSAFFDFTLFRSLLHRGATTVGKPIPRPVQCRTPPLTAWRFWCAANAPTSCCTHHQFLPLCHMSHSTRDMLALAPDHRHLSPSCHVICHVCYWPLTFWDLGVLYSIFRPDFIFAICFCIWSFNVSICIESHSSR